jgi:hypothetical protein
MLKATRDFAYASITIRAGQEIVQGLFEADQVGSLIRKGWIEDISPAPKVKPKQPQAPKKVVTKRAASKK